MTKHTNDSPDRPALTDLEITPAMIEAGVDALSLWDSGEDASLVVLSVFDAMLAVSREPR